MRSANALETGRTLARQRREFREGIRDWSDIDLRSRMNLYSVETIRHPNAQRFYVTRIRAIGNELFTRWWNDFATVGADNNGG